MKSDYVKVGIPSPYVIPGLIRGKLDESIVIKEVCKYYGKQQDFVFKKYQRSDPHVKHIAIYIMVKRLRCSLKSLGRLFNVHHSTIIYSVKLVDGQITARHENIYKSDLQKIIDTMQCYKTA